MDTDNLQLAGLLGSRICHDLISPLGAIGNGLELIQLALARDLPELALAREAADAASGRLKFFRICFGNAASGEQITRAELASILDARFAASRITVNWQSAPSVMRAEARACLLAVLCLETALHRGGEISVTQRPDGWHLVARGGGLRLVAPGWQILGVSATTTAATAPAEPTAREVPFLLLLAQGAGKAPLIETGEDMVEIHLPTPRGGR